MAAPGGRRDSSIDDADPEQGPTQSSIRDHNYGGLASLMSADPDVLIIRQFVNLNARSLLYSQAKLMTLEKQLASIETEIRKDDTERLLQNWSAVANPARAEVPIKLQYRKVIEKVNEAIYKHNEILKQQQFLSNLPQPSEYDLRLLRTWINFKEGKYNPFLVGDDKTAFSYDHEEDLVFVGPKKNFDPFTDRFLKAGTVAWDWLKRHLSNPNGGFHAYNERGVVRIISLGATVVACMLPVASIIVLHQLPTDPAWQRLLTLAMFTLAFILALLSFTKAKRSEVFAAAAAFAAVQVLFIGTNNDSTKSITLPSTGVNVTISPLNNSRPS